MNGGDKITETNENTELIRESKIEDEVEEARFADFTVLLGSGNNARILFFQTHDKLEIDGRMISREELEHRRIAELVVPISTLKPLKEDIEELLESYENRKEQSPKINSKMYG